MDFAGNKNLRLERLEPVAAAARSTPRAPGSAVSTRGWRRRASDPRSAISPPGRWKMRCRTANRAGFDELVFAGFGFDAAAQAAIGEGGHARLRLHMALIRPDVAMGELLKTQPGSQLFTVSAPLASSRLSGCRRAVAGGGGRHGRVRPVGGALHPPPAASASPRGSWTPTTTTAASASARPSFPDRKKWDKLARALGDKGGGTKAASTELDRLRHAAVRPPARAAAGQTLARSREGDRPAWQRRAGVLTMPEAG